MSNMRQQIRVFVDREMSPAARAARLASVARSTVADLVAAGRASPRYETSVDGVPGASEDAVRPDGRITYNFAYIGEAVEFALAFLQARSAPAVSGTYRDSFVVAVDGRPILARQFRKTSVPVGAEVFIYNTQPYSRKLDVQLVGTRSLAYRTPQFLFEDAAQAVKTRFGNSVTAKRIYNVNFAGQYTTRREQISSRGFLTYRVTPAGRLVESPALVLRGLA